MDGVKYYLGFVMTFGVCLHFQREGAGFVMAEAVHVPANPLIYNSLVLDPKVEHL